MSMRAVAGSEFLAQMVQAAKLPKLKRMTMLGMDIGEFASAVAGENRLIRPATARHVAVGYTGIRRAIFQKMLAYGELGRENPSRFAVSIFHFSSPDADRTWTPRL
jgi:hypothetical protein